MLESRRANVPFDETFTFDICNIRNGGNKGKEKRDWNLEYIVIIFWTILINIQSYENILDNEWLPSMSNTSRNI